MVDSSRQFQVQVQVQVLNLLFSIFFIASILSLVTASAIQGGDNDKDDDIVGDGGGGGNSKGNSLLLADLRASAYVAMTTLCVYCSMIIKDFKDPIRLLNEESEVMSNIIRNQLVCVWEHVTFLSRFRIELLLLFFII